MNNYIKDTENINNKLVELEDHSRRNNIRIDGVKENSRKECERRVHSTQKKKVRHKEC